VEGKKYRIRKNGPTWPATLPTASFLK